MKEIIIRCCMFSGRGWISTFLFVSDWTPSPNDLSHIGNLWTNITYKAKDKTDFMYWRLSKYQDVSPLYLCTVFHCVGFPHKLHVVRYGKSRFTTSQPQIKQKRKLAILKVQRKLLELSPRWPRAFWCWQ